MERISSAYARFRGHLAEITTPEPDMSNKPRKIIVEALKEVGYNGDLEKFNRELKTRTWTFHPETESVKAAVSRKIHHRIMGRVHMLPESLVDFSFETAQIIQVMCFYPIAIGDETEGSAALALAREVTKKSLWGTMPVDAGEQYEARYTERVGITIGAMQDQNYLQVIRKKGKETMFLTSDIDRLLR